MEKDWEKKRGELFPLLGFPGFPAARPVHRALVLGERAEDFTVYLAAFAAVRGFRVRVADGANAFDPYIVSKYARSAGLPPDKLLKKIEVARAFTCHQLATLIRERLDAQILPGAPHLVLLLGPCTMFFDEDVPGEEAALIFRKILAKVGEMSGRGVFFLLGQSFSGFNKRRGFFLRDLAESADAVLKLKAAADALEVTLAKPALKPPALPWGVFEEFKKLP